jgi:2-dehydro-3-deoxygluconokinase
VSTCSTGQPGNRRRVALIGECLLELSGTPFGALHQTFGGDSLNTALYMARLGVESIEVKYVSALGQDCLSDGMLQRWRAEGIDTGLVLRAAGRLPGMYLIQVDQHGERSFLYWRGESAARYLLQHAEFDRVAAALAEVDLIYLSGISLAILPAADRTRLLALLKTLAGLNVNIAFDSNYRPALWPSVEAAREAINTLLPVTRLMFVTFEDEQRLWGDDTPAAALARLHAAGAQSVIIKLGAAGCLYSDGSSQLSCAARVIDRVIDTTAAGDAFNAGFLSSWLRQCTPQSCCRAGNALAGVVIQHRGAIIPAAATPALSELLRP